MSLKQLSLRATRGDTIVEVMVVLAVLGLAIGISYATANHSLLDVRQAQENSQAAELVQSQTESLRAMVGNPKLEADNVTPNPDYIFGYSSPQLFCIDSSGAHVALTSTAMPSASCHYDSLYDVTIGYSSLPTDTFTITATWPDVEGQGNDTVTITYRLHSP